ncbi:MAG: hypothetical protein ACP5HS_11290, partial [Anaerolineae bacterium]
ELVSSNDIQLNISYEDATLRPTTMDSVGPRGRIIVTIQYLVEPLTPILGPIMPDGLLLRTENRRTIQTVRSDAPSTLAAPAPPPIPPTDTPTPGAEPTYTATPKWTETPPATATNTPTNTPTSTPTPSPTSIPPIVIQTPVTAGETEVRGTAAGEYGITLRIIQTGLQRNIAVNSDGTFAFTGLPDLIAGHTVVVQGYGTQDSTIVQEAPTPVPDTSYIYIDELCLEPGTTTLIVHGGNFDRANVGKVEEIRIFWNGEQVLSAPHDYNVSTFDHAIEVDVTEPGPHILSAQGFDKQGNLLVSPPELTVEVCQPTPTPGPLPDLVFRNLEVTDEGPLGTYDTIHLVASISNDSETAVTKLFWIDLFVDPDQDTPLEDQFSVDTVALNVLGAQSTISFTMYVPGGFPEVGTYNIVGMVDVFEQIEELDEDNNVSATQVVTLTVANLDPTPTPVVTPGPTGGVTMITYIKEGINYIRRSNVSVIIFCDDRPVASGRSDEDGKCEFAEIPIGTCVAEGQFRLGDVSYAGTKAIIISEDVLEEEELILTAFGY